MIQFRLIFFTVTSAVFVHSADVLTPKTTLDIFTQIEPEINPWWFQRVSDTRPHVSILPNLNFFGSNVIASDCVTLDQCTMKRLYDGPIFIVTKDPKRSEELTAYYTEKGLNTIFKDDLYTEVNEYLRSLEPKAAVLFNSRRVYNYKIANKSINKIVTPRDFKLSDLDVLSRIGDKVPVLFVTDKIEFDNYKFEYIKHFGKFSVFDDKIEPEIK